MMTAATFGDLLGQARDHLARAAGFPDSGLRGESVIAAATVTGRLARTLSRYLGDIAPYGMAEAIANRSLHPRTRAAVDAREALRMAAATLHAGSAGAGDPGGELADPLAARLAAAAGSLTAGRDLLGTHFAASPDGAWSQQSDWSAVITSAPVTRALAAEVASWSRQLAFLMTRLSLAAEMTVVVPAAVHHGLASGCHWLLTASAAITAGQRSGPATQADAGLLHAVPANAALLRQPPGGGETAGELAGGVAMSAARLRVATWGTAEQAAWSEAMTAESWRWTATGAAVTCHVSQLLLGSLAGRPGLFTGMPDVALQLSAAGETAARACARWREVASAWNDITTETRGLTAPGIPDAGDLIVRLGRLAFTDSHWTPTRVRHSPLRDPAELAPGPAQFTAVVSAVHHAVSAVVSIATTDLRAVDVAIRASRLHVPTRTLSDRYDVPRKFANAIPSTAAALLDAYQAASAAIDVAAADLDALAVTVGAPSRILGFARAAVRLGPDTAATRMADGPPARAAAAPAPDGRELAASPPPGTAELAVRGHGTPDLGLLLRASVIDKATRLLIAEVKGSEDSLSAAGPTAGDGRPGEAARSPARIASEGFPTGPVTSKAGRIPGRARSRGLPPVSRTAVPGRVPPGGGRHPS